MQDLIQAIETQSKEVVILGVSVDLTYIKELPRNRDKRTKFINDEAKKLYKLVLGC